MRSIENAITLSVSIIAYAAARSAGLGVAAFWIGAVALIAGIGVCAWMRSGGPY